MNELFRTIVNQSCGENFDIFEKTFNENTEHHNFSSRHKRKMEAVFKNCSNPALARKKYEAEPFWGKFGAKQFAAAAAGLVLTGGLIFGGVKAVDMFSDIANTNKRYDELLKDGNYYLEGDKSIYFKANDGSVILIGDKNKIMDIMMSDEWLAAADARDPDHKIRMQVEYITDYYMSGINYAIVEAGEGYTVDENGNQIPIERPKYGFVDLANCSDEPWNSYVFTFTRLSLMFDGDDTIYLEPLGNLVLDD